MLLIFVLNHNNAPSNPNPETQNEHKEMGKIVKWSFTSVVNLFFTRSYAAVAIILLVGAGTDLRLIWCNVPPQSSPNQRIKGTLAPACLEGALVPSSAQLFTAFSSPSRLHTRPQNNQASYFFRAAEFPNAQHLLIDVNWNFYPPPPSLYQVSGTLGLLGFNTDGTTAFIPKKKKKL